jgi:hypothetical protein
MARIAARADRRAVKATMDDLTVLEGALSGLISRGSAKAGRPYSVSGDGATGMELSVQPTRVFKRSSDQNRLRTEYWLFNLMLRAPMQDKPGDRGAFFSAK